LIEKKYYDSNCICRSGNTKHIMLFANLWQIAGSFMYFVGLSKAFLISGRLVAGKLNNKIYWKLSRVIFIHNKHFMLTKKKIY
jgi:hypothetical protein